MLMRKAWGTDGAPIRRYWSEPSPENRETLRKALTPEVIRRVHRYPQPGCDPAGGYTLDAPLIARSGNVMKSQSRTEHTVEIKLHSV